VPVAHRLRHWELVLCKSLEFAPCLAYLTLRRLGRATRGMTMTNPLQFMQQVRSEVGKVVWPTRREVLLTTAMVFVMAALTAVFFALVDLLIRLGVTALVG